MNTNKELEKQFTKEELDKLKVLSCPILWAEKYLKDPMNPNKPFKLRWYQKEILNCKNRKKVVRAGRRIGKSVTLITEILWKLYTRQYRRLVLITPYKSQIQELWEIMDNMMQNSPEIKNSIKRKVNNPHQLELYNGSQLKCFTAGSKSSSKGANIRSISAHDIYLDEADYLGENALSAIEPLILTDSDTTFWASSTPTGRRERFYKWATRSNELGFKAFHFPSSISPNWVSIKDAKKKGLKLSESTEYYFKSTNPESVYVHEYDAEFGEEVEGVFKASFLDDNIYDFDEDIEHANLQLYDPMYKQNPKNIYIMGIDWNNSVNGTQIVITEYLREETKITYFDEDIDGERVKKSKKIKNKFRMFYRESLSLGEDTQLYSIKKIIQLLKKYKIDHIYSDMGFGQTNIEILREYGKKHKELQLKRKLNPIDFGTKINIFDPLKKCLVSKHMKPFIVYTAVNEMEKGNCILPLIEDDDGRLIGQIRSFSIKKHSQTGVPIFSQGNEHILIAWLLSIVGFHMEYSTLIHPEINQEDSSIGRVRRSNKLMPYLNNLERKTIKDTGTVSSLFNNIDSAKPLISDKVTTDPGFYNDTEKKDSYTNNKVKSPWGSQMQKINYFKSGESKGIKGSPTGRKLIPN